MYVPAHFREDRLELLHSFIERHPLGSLVASYDGELSADHIPMLVARDQGAKGTLHGHVARANPLWRSVASGSDVLVLFGGASAYVSPSWYASKGANAEVVPTWNYAVVHVHGRIQFYDDATRLRTLVASLTNHHERNQRTPWSIDDAPGAYVQKMLRAIVGFEIEVRDITGKFKASQNKSDQDRAGVRDALQAANTASTDELVLPPRGTPLES